MSTKYENQSEYYSISIHNHTNLCGTTARAESSTRIIREDTAKELQDHAATTQDTLQDHAVKTQDTLVDAEETNDGVISYNSTISTCEKCQHSEAHCIVERQCNEAERGPRAPDSSGNEISRNSAISTCEGEISYNSAISTCEKLEKHDCFFDYNALEDDDEFVGVLDRDDEVNE